MALEESTLIPQVTGKTDRRTVNVFLILGIIGLLGTIILELIHTGIYLEYLRVYNLDPTDWLTHEPIVNMLVSLSTFYFYPAILSTLGFYGVIDRNRGRFGLFFVFIMLWPYSFDIYELLYMSGLPISYDFAYAVSTAFSTAVAVIAGLILSTTRYNIGKPKLLYLLIILMIAGPIVYFILNIFGPIGIAANATEYLIQYSPGMAVYYTRLTLAIGLFFIEYRRDN